MNIRDENGWTPLYMALVFNKSPAIVATLLQLGADPNLRPESASDDATVKPTTKGALVVLERRSLARDGPRVRNARGVGGAESRSMGIGPERTSTGG